MTDDVFIGETMDRISLFRIGLPGVSIPSEISGPLIKNILSATPENGDDEKNGSLSGEHKIDLGAKPDATAVTKGQGIWVNRSSAPELEDLCLDISLVFSRYLSEKELNEDTLVRLKQTYPHFSEGIDNFLNLLKKADEIKKIYSNLFGVTRFRVRDLSLQNIFNSISHEPSKVLLSNILWCRLLIAEEEDLVSSAVASVLSDLGIVVGTKDEKINVSLETTIEKIVSGELKVSLSGLQLPNETSLKALFEEVLTLYQQFPDDYEGERGLPLRLRLLTEFSPQNTQKASLTPSQLKWFEISLKSPDATTTGEMSYRINDFYESLKEVYSRKSVASTSLSPEEHFEWVRDTSARRLLIDLLWARTIEFKRADPMPEAINISRTISRAGKNTTTISPRELIELIITGKIPLRMER